MPTSFIIVWVTLVAAAYLLRLYCVSAIRTQSPRLYELVGKPAYISRYSWGFLHKVSKYPEFQELTHGARSAVRVAIILDVTLTVLTGLLVLMWLRAFLGH